MSTMLTERGSLPLPLSSLRLLVPPLQLVSAALLQIVKQGDVMHYGLLEDFVTTVLETIPELLSHQERAQLLMGLRAKVVLELCHNDCSANPQAIQLHLSRMNTYMTHQDKETSSSEVEAPVKNFLKLVTTLVDDKCQRDIFYQKIFPTVFGPEYDSALQALMRKFLFNLQQLLPVPDLEQTSLWLSLTPSVLKECVDFVNQPEPLNTLIEHHKHHRNNIPEAFSSSVDDCILSSLSYHLQNEEEKEGDTIVKSGSECVSQDSQSETFLDSESENDEVEDFEGINSEFKGSVRNGQQQCVDEPSEDQGVSVKAIQPFDESVSNDDELSEDQGPSGEVILQPSSLVCRVCDKVFTYQKSFDKHQTICTVGSTRWTSLCRVCGRVFAYKKHLDKHQTICMVGGVRETSLGSESKNDGEEFKGIHSEFKGKVRNGQQQCVDEPSEDHGVSVKAIQPFDESVSNDDDNHLNQKGFRHLKTVSKPFKRTFRCLVCGQDFSCLWDLKEHKSTNSSCFTDRMGKAERIKNPIPKTCIESDLNRLPNHENSDIDLSLVCRVCGRVYRHPSHFDKHQKICMVSSTSETFLGSESKTTCIEGDSFGNESEMSSSACATTHNPSNLNSLPNLEHSDIDSSFVCRVCGRVYTYIKNFEKHQRICMVSSKRQAKTQQSSSISSAHHSKPKHGFKTKKSLHSETENNTSNVVPLDSIPCDTPQEQTVKRSSRVKQCSQCGKSFTSSADLMRHMRCHSEQSPYLCACCGKDFGNSEDYETHQEGKRKVSNTHPQDIPSRNTIKKNQENTVGSSGVAQISMIPDAPANLQACRSLLTCQSCGKGFLTHKSYKKHQSKCSKRPPRRKPCERPPNVCSCCGKQFKSKYTLSKHMSRHTVPQGGFFCPVCGKNIHNKVNLKWHMNKHNGIVEPFLCDTCGKSWPSKAQLKAHMFQHTDERPYKCEICGVSYKRPDVLLAHRRSKHLRLRPFACEVCSKAFELKSKLKLHMMIHTGEQPYSCQRCGKKFQRIYSLNQHRKKAC